MNSKEFNKQTSSTERIRLALRQLNLDVSKGREYPDAETDASENYRLSPFETRRMRAWYDAGWTPPSIES